MRLNILKKYNIISTYRDSCNYILHGNPNDDVIIGPITDVTTYAIFVTGYWYI